MTIFFSYIYTANLFITIARDAGDELVNTRIGSLQDAFAPLASEVWHNRELLNQYIETVSQNNATIIAFDVLEKQAGSWRVVASLQRQKIGDDIVGFDWLIMLALADTKRSYTVEETDKKERFFRTVRVVVSRESGEVLGILMTRQTLSAADYQILASIREGVWVLIAVLLLLLLLFFKHARILDYTVLYRRLKEVDAMKDDFLSMASHELRTPLSAIRGYIDLLSTSGEITSAEGHKYLSRVDTSARELDQLIADILDVSRIEQGRLAFNLKEMQVGDIIEIVCDTLDFKAHEKGLNITCNIEANPVLHIDADRFRQVVVNLVGNAIKYTDHGEITVKTTQEGDYFVLRVSDTGIGMTAEQQKNLFQKFYRVESSEVRKQVGTGLGLWITKQIIEHMQGSISVESIKGVGSHFIVRFPVVKTNN